MTNKPFIAVSLNYRVQAFGFLFGTPILDAGVSNLGYKDQRLGLHWIQENIAAFGGDPTRVTIGGESAGASSVGQQMVAYGGRDDALFRGAIMECRGPINSKPVLTAADWDVYYNNITAAVNCSSAADTLACLRTVPIDTLITVLNSSVTASVPSWGAQVDGDWLRNGSVSMLVTGQIVKVPILHGRNHDEGTMFATKGINTTEQFLTRVKDCGFDDEEAATIEALCPDISAFGIPSTLDGRPTGEYAYIWETSGSELLPSPAMCASTPHDH
jgi:triacylglycerol lipase